MTTTLSTVQQMANQMLAAADLINEALAELPDTSKAANDADDEIRRLVGVVERAAALAEEARASLEDAAA